MLSYIMHSSVSLIFICSIWRWYRFSVCRPGRPWHHLAPLSFWGMRKCLIRVGSGNLVIQIFRIHKNFPFVHCLWCIFIKKKNWNAHWMINMRRKVSLQKQSFYSPVYTKNFNQLLKLNLQIGSTNNSLLQKAVQGTIYAIGNYSSVKLECSTRYCSVSLLYKHNKI